MCRFVLYLGRPIPLDALVTSPENSLIHQSFASREREEPLNGDGFGIAWYVPEMSAHAAQFRMITPAWSNQNLRHLARITRSGCVLAHVRAASPGLPVTETNSHPFVSGRYSFMHNGDIAGFPEIKRPLLDRLGREAYRMIEGTTDSEHLFALFLERLSKQPEQPPQEAMAAALEGAVSDTLSLLKAARITEESTFNIAVSDGTCAVVCRFSNGNAADVPSLHLQHRRHYHCESGVPRLIDAEPGDHAVIVSSEPLTEDPEWDVVPASSIVVIASDRQVEVRAFRPSTPP